MYVAGYIIKTIANIYAITVFVVRWCPGGDVGGSEEKPQVISLLTLSILLIIYNRQVALQR